MTGCLRNPQRAKDERAIKAIKRAGFTVATLAVTLFAVWALAGCSTPKIEYRPIPDHMIPQQLKLPKVKAEEIPRCDVGQKPCMTDETYVKFVEMVDALKLQNAELRALLGVTP